MAAARVTVDRTAVVRWIAFTLPGRILIGAAVVALIAVTVVAPRLAGSTPTTPTRTAPVTRGNVLQTVAVSGSLNAAGTVRLNFSTAGRLAEVLVRVGDAVAKDQPLARLDTTDLQTTVRQREADLATQQARYDSTVGGLSGPDLAIAQNSLEQARRSYEDTKRTTAQDLAAAERSLAGTKTAYLAAKTNFTTLASGLRTDAAAYESAIATLRTRVVALADHVEAMNRTSMNAVAAALDTAEQALTTAGTYAAWSLQPAAAEYAAMTDALLGAVATFDRAIAGGADTAGASASFQTAEAGFQTAGSRTSSAIDAPGGQVSSALTSLTAVHNTLTSPDFRGDNTLDFARNETLSIQIALQNEQQLGSTMKSRIAQATSALAGLAQPVEGGYVAALESYATAQQRAASSLASQESALRSAELSYQRTTAAPSAADTSSAYASLLSAQVALEKAKNDLSGATLRAPMAGFVASIAAQPGETVTTGGATGFMVVANTSSLTLHGTVGESEVASLKLGQAATVTVDAITGARMTGRISALDPVATIQQGVPVYGVDIQIDVPQTAVRAGMTATAAIIVASKRDVLTVPNLAVRSQSGRRFVQVLQEGKVVDADVTLGIANDSVTEVMSGLEEGDEVVLPQPRTTSTTQQQPGAGGVRIGGGVPGGGVPFR